MSVVSEIANSMFLLDTPGPRVAKASDITNFNIKYDPFSET